MMNRRYITAQAENTATMLLHGFIGSEITSKEFISDLIFLDSLNLEEITISVNSGGGDVFQGWAIFAAIEATSTPIHMVIEGMAASMAAGLILAGDKVSMRDFSMLMVHAASIGRPVEDQTPEDIKLLADVNAGLVRVIQARTNMSKEDTEKLFTGQDHWFSAKESLKLGFVDNIIKTKAKKNKMKAEADEILSAVMNILSKQGSVNEIYATYNDLLKPKLENMNVLKAQLNLSENATEAEVINAVNAIEGKIVVDGKEVNAESYTELVASNKKMAEQLKEVNAVTAEAHKEKVIAIVKKAIEDSKITPESEELYTNMGVENIEQLEAIFKSFSDTVHPGSITDSLVGDAGKPGAKREFPSMNNESTFNMEDKSTWNHRNYEKHDEDGLAAIYANTPEIADKMYHDCYDEAATE